MNPRQSLGYYDHNPGNVRRTNDKWQGEIKSPDDPDVSNCAPGDTAEIIKLSAYHRREQISTPNGFVVTKTPEFGTRVLAKNIIAQWDVGKKTIKQIIAVWAPEVDHNDTAAYIASVAKAVGIGSDEPIANIRDYKILYAIADAIIRVECGGMPYRGHELEDGLMMAGIVKPVSLGTSMTAKGATMATTGVGGSTALDAVQQPVQQLADSLAPMVGTAHIVDNILLACKVALGVIAMIGVGIMLYERIKNWRRDEKKAAMAETMAAEVGQ